MVWLCGCVEMMSVTVAVAADCVAGLGASGDCWVHAATTMSAAATMNKVARRRINRIIRTAEIDPRPVPANIAIYRGSSAYRTVSAHDRVAAPTGL
jgi:hypothetical protein